MNPMNDPARAIADAAEHDAALAKLRALVLRVLSPDGDLDIREKAADIVWKLTNDYTNSIRAASDQIEAMLRDRQP